MGLPNRLADLKPWGKNPRGIDGESLPGRRQG